MSKKKSLGSSPIGFGAGSKSMSFIPDIRRSESNNRNRTGRQAEMKKSTTSLATGKDVEKKNENKEKKVVSYYLEKDLITKVKRIADQQEMYYSSFVSKILTKWISQHDEQLA